jgi:hypothetical protein
MQQSYAKYPVVRAEDHTTILTDWGTMHHMNAVPTERSAEALQKALDIATRYDTPVTMLNIVMAFLADVPVAPLLAADPKTKASVMGLVVLGYVLKYSGQETTLRNMLARGDGFVILRIGGEVTKPEAELDLFENWQTYQDFLLPALAALDMEQGKSSTLL